MANVNKGKGGKDPEAPPAATTPVTEIPKFRDDAGNLLKLRSRDFPRTKEGKMAVCDYHVERWLAKKERIRIAADPQTRKLKKIAKLKEMLQKLEKEVAAEAAAAGKPAEE